VFKQNANDNSTNVINHTADIARDARLSHLNFNLGSLMCRHNISFRINEEGGHADAHGLYTLKNNQHCDTHSLIDHNAPHTTSNQLYKSVLDDRSRGVFTGLIRIQSHAQKVDSAQLNKNLLISPKAHANSRPQIEVFADDVKAGHGSTTGQLSEESLFYFISRGIKEERARALLSKAFVNDVILKVRDLKIREELSELILSNMKVLN
jgi:Fe-S cluster assembly protein SufD